MKKNITLDRSLFNCFNRSYLGKIFTLLKTLHTPFKSKSQHPTIIKMQKFEENAVSASCSYVDEPELLSLNSIDGHIVKVSRQCWYSDVILSYKGRHCCGDHCGCQPQPAPTPGLRPSHTVGKVPQKQLPETILSCKIHINVINGRRTILFQRQRHPSVKEISENRSCIGDLLDVSSQVLGSALMLSE